MPQPSNSALSRNPRLWILLALILASRVLLAIVIWGLSGPGGFYRNDTVTYVGPAESLLNGAFLSTGAYSLPGTPELFRTPGYPLLLVPAVALHHVVIIALLENFVLVGISAWLIWRIANDLAGPKAGFWAAVLYAIEPMGFLQAETILSETLFTTLFLLFALLLLRFFRSPSTVGLAQSAFVLGCATYVRPVPMYLWLWLAPAFLVFPRFLPWRQRAWRAAQFALVFLLTVAPWVVRNSAEAGYKAFSTSQDWNLYFMSAASVEAKLQHRNSAQLMHEWGATTSIEDYFRSHPEQRGWSEAQVARFWHDEARRIIRDHPAMYAAIHARGCLRVILNPGISEALKTIGLFPDSSNDLSLKLAEGTGTALLWLVRQYPVAVILAPLMTLQLFIYYALAIRGFRRMPIEPRFLFTWIFLYFVLVSGFPAAMARYRVPVMPLVCIAAGIAIVSWKALKIRDMGHDDKLPGDKLPNLSAKEVITL